MPQSLVDYINDSIAINSSFHGANFNIMKANRSFLKFRVKAPVEMDPLIKSTSPLRCWIENKKIEMTNVSAILRNSQL